MVFSLPVNTGFHGVDLRERGMLGMEEREKTNGRAVAS